MCDFKLTKIGALTSKPYAFTARSWELKNIESIDVFDSVGSNIKIGTRGSSVLRVLPKINDLINEEWITDKVRFSYDAFKSQRILYCYKKNQVGFHKINWSKVFSLLRRKSSIEYTPISKMSKLPNLNFFVGAFSDLETLDYVRQFQFSLKHKSFSFVNTSLSRLNFDLRSDYLLDSEKSNMEQLEILLLIGCNPRLEAPILNLKIRKNVINRSLKVYNFGFNSNLTYVVQNLGANINKLIALLEGRCSIIKRFLNKRSFVLFGVSFMQNTSHLDLKGFFEYLGIYNGLLTGEASSLNSYEIGITPRNLGTENTTLNVNWLLNEDKSIFNSSNKFNLYSGHHGDFNFRASDLILPSTLFSEKNSIFINYQGYVQKTRFVDSSLLNKDIRDELVFMKTFLNQNKNSLIDLYSKTRKLNLYSLKKEFFQKTIKIDNSNSYYYMQDFYRNDSISRNSPVMALTSNRLNFRRSSFSK